MSMSRLLVALALAGACVTSARAGAAATDTDISRITLRMPGEGWIVSGRLPYGVPVDTGRTVDGERRLVALGKSGSRNSIVMLVSATRGAGATAMHADCDPEADYYVRKFNRGQSTTIPLQCLRIIGPSVLPKLEQIGGPLGEAMIAQQVMPPGVGYFATVRVSNDNGAIVQIQALIGNGFTGLEGRPPVARVPEGMRPAVAAWADLLAEDALGTLSSLFARLEVPPVTFTHPVDIAAPAASATASKD